MKKSFKKSGSNTNIIDKLNTKNLNDNIAVAKFNNDRLLNYESWYDPDIISYLSHIITQQELLKYVFVDDNDPSKAFASQLESLILISRTLKSNSFCFISKEASAGQNHLIFGVCVNDQLLIVNPIGQTKHKDFYESIYDIFSDLTNKWGINLKLYISSNTTQEDGNDISSCCPI